MISLFEVFVKDTYKGKRRKHTQERIKPQTAKTYESMLHVLKDYEIYYGKKVMIRINVKGDRRSQISEMRYWENFYRKFSLFMYQKRGCFDNYVGHFFKVIKCFFRYLKEQKLFQVSDFYKRFYARQDKIRIISLSPERLFFLITDKEFQQKLTIYENRYREYLVFGSIAALRYSDLMNLKVRDVEQLRINNEELKMENGYFLYYRSLKTDTPVRIKLPEFAAEIFKKYSKGKKPLDKIFTGISIGNFNKHLQKIAFKAQWTEPIGRIRHHEGEETELRIKNEKLRTKSNTGGIYRFCDMMGSHVMRRTGITILLMLGMPELLVRKISGHSAHSKEFYRYVDFAQSFITEEIEKAYKRLMETR